MIRSFDIWENPTVNVPQEVQEYLDSIESSGNKVLDSYSFSYGTPDGEVSSVSYTVTWLDGMATVKTREFFYDFTPEGEVFDRASDEAWNDSCAVLRWAKKLIECNPELKEHWKWLSKSEEVA